MNFFRVKMEELPSSFGHDIYCGDWQFFQLSSEDKPKPRLQYHDNSLWNGQLLLAINVFWLEQNINLQAESDFDAHQKPFDF